jgi:hypothetical protein
MCCLDTPSQDQLFEDYTELNMYRNPWLAFEALGSVFIQYRTLVPQNAYLG